MLTKCIKCQKKFRYRMIRGHKHFVCKSCLRENLEQHKRRHRERLRCLPTEERKNKKETQEGIVLRSLPQVAKLMDCQPSSVYQLERNAFAKIRETPEARRLWKWWQEEGCPTPASAEADVGRLLMEWQLALSDWWNLHDKLAEGNQCIQEAEECKREIATFFGALKRMMGEVVNQV